MSRAAAAACAALAALCACAKEPQRCARVENGCAVRLSYTLMVDGKRDDLASPAEPAEARVGSGELVAGLERGLLGLRPGDSSTITVSPEDGFGRPDPARIQAFPKERFAGLGEVKPGMTVQGVSGGRAAAGRVVSASAGSVTLDFNHRLAGKTLVYYVRVEGVGP
jgi:FKBP-type peptidyl-prolyl cis-trans isomerase 2